MKITGVYYSSVTDTGQPPCTKSQWNFVAEVDVKPASQHLAQHSHLFSAGFFHIVGS